jgi:hypothetical protein
VSDPFDLSGLFSDFFGAGSVPPESVARKVLGIGTVLPLNAEGIKAAFRWRVRLLRPDLGDAAADALRVRHVAGETEWRPADEIKFESGSKQEQLAELLWAREDLLRRIPKPATSPVTGMGGAVRGGASPTGAVTEWAKREQERRAENGRRWQESEELRRQRRDERNGHESERRREWRRAAKHRRSRREPRELRCRDCRKVIDRDEVALVGSPRQGTEFMLNPYNVSRAWWNDGGYYHASCLLDLPLRPVPWLEKFLADGVPLETACEVCGRRVKPPRWVKRRDGGKVFFCSEGCAGGADAIARRVEPTERECVVCSERFTPARSDARYCSAACRQDAYRKRKLGATLA